MTSADDGATTTSRSHRAPAPTMSKGTRFVTFAVPAVLAYFLLLLHVLPAPFLSQETADQILPVVSAPAKQPNLAALFFARGYS